MVRLRKMLCWNNLTTLSAARVCVCVCVCVCVKQPLALTCYRGIGAGLLFPPRRHKHCDVMMATL